MSIEKAGEETEQVKYYNSRSAFLRQFNGMRNGLNLCYYLRIQLTLSDDIVNIQYAVSSYFNIIMSVVVLVYSLVNGNARYDNRISTIKEAIDAVKREKRSLQLGNTTVEEAREKYDRIIESTEYREDIDFFVTVKLLCKKYEVSWWRIPHVSSTEVSTDQKRVMNYLHELNPYFLQCRIVFEFVGYVALIAVPIVIFGLCILAKVNSWIM